MLSRRKKSLRSASHLALATVFCLTLGPQLVVAQETKGNTVPLATSHSPLLQSHSPLTLVVHGGVGDAGPRKLSAQDEAAVRWH